MQPDKVKLVYLHQHFRTPEQGGGTRTWEFARRLADDNYDVVMICGGAERLSYTTGGFRVEQLRAAYGNDMSAARRMLSFALFMAQASVRALRERGTLYLASSTPLTVAIPALISHGILKRPYIFEVRDVWPEVPVALGYMRSRLLIRIAEHLERVAYNHASSIIALSPGMEASIRRVTSTPVHVIPNAADTEMFCHFAHEATVNEASRPLIIYAGSLGRIYDVPAIARLHVHLKSQGIQLIAIGDGAMRLSGEEYLRSRGLNPQECFVGTLPKPQVADQILRAEAVLSSVVSNSALHAASINKIFDGFAAGKPVICNHGGWLADIIKTEGAGLVLEGRDEFDQAAEIARFLGDLTALRRAGDASRRLGEIFSRDRLYRKLESILSDTVSSRTEPKAAEQKHAPK